MPIKAEPASFKEDVEFKKKLDFDPKREIKHGFELVSKMKPSVERDLKSKDSLAFAMGLDAEELSTKIPGLAMGLKDPMMEQQVSVTLTLSASATEDIVGVLSSIADLLKIAVPPSYEISRSPSPELFKLNMKREPNL